MLTLYDSMLSANSYKPRLLLHQLCVAYRRVEVDLMSGETRRAPFLALNPNGRVPTLVLDSGTAIAESGAILFHLAENTPFLAASPEGRAQTLQWLFFEQYSHEPYLAVTQFFASYPDVPDPRRAIRDFLFERGCQALSVMDGHLATRPFFVADRYSIADIALYAYTHRAAIGGFDLARWPHVRTWLERVRAEPRHIPFDQA